jgi:hypothetical protein
VFSKARIKSLNEEYAEMNVEKDIIAGEREDLIREKTEAQGSARELAATLEEQRKETERSQVQLKAVASSLEIDVAESADIETSIREMKTKLRTLEQELAERSTDTGKEAEIEALRSQHGIELSERDSRIRRMQEEAHNEANRIHRMSKQMSDLENELATLRSQTASRSIPVAPGSTPLVNVNSRPSSLAVPGPSLVIPPTASIDASLPPSMRHKRQISLAMLKARMSGPPPSLSRNTSRTNMSGVIAQDDEAVEAHLPDSLSDDAVFWCSACSSQTLITL